MRKRVGPNSTRPNDPHRLIGRVFGDRYKITGLLGTGGMSAVYSAQHTRLSKVVALKVLARDAITQDEKQMLRFTQEAKACSRLQHRNIIRVFDYGQSNDGLWFIAMELLQGMPLGRRIKNKGALDARRACLISADVCEGLTEAHKRGIIHRDLKPDNVFLCLEPDGSETLKILDFGIAKVASETTYETLTQTGFICGTPLYISPEQSLGMQLDGRTDLYSVGVMLYEMLTGKTPFTADSPIALVMKHIHNVPPKMEAVNPDAKVPDELKELVYQLMGKDREKRPESAQVVKQLLLDIASRLPKTVSEVHGPNVMIAALDTAPIDDSIGGQTRIQPGPSVLETVLQNPILNTQDLPAIKGFGAPGRHEPVEVTKASSGSLLLYLSLAAAIVVALATLGLLAYMDWGRGAAGPETHSTDTTPGISAEGNPPAPSGTTAQTAQTAGVVEPALPTATQPALSTTTEPALPTTTGPALPATTEPALPATTEPAAKPTLAEASVVDRNSALTTRRERRVLSLAYETIQAAGPDSNDTPAPRLFLIDSKPRKADVVIRGEIVGQTPFWLEVGPDMPDTTVIVMKRGRVPRTWTWKAASAPPPGQDKVLLELKRKRAPQRDSGGVIWKD